MQSHVNSKDEASLFGDTANYMNKKGVTTMDIDFANTLKLGDLDIGDSESKELVSPKDDRDINRSSRALGDWEQTPYRSSHVESNNEKSASALKRIQKLEEKKIKYNTMYRIQQKSKKIVKNMYPHPVVPRLYDDDLKTGKQEKDTQHSQY